MSSTTSQAPLTRPCLTAPDPGEVLRIAEGIFWIRMPLPFRLNHVNLWLFEDGDGWAMVDCGVNDATSRAIWDSLFSGFLAGRPIRRVIATHGHTDHVGAASLLRERNDATFEASLTEWMAARIRFADHHDDNTAALESFLSSHGCDASILEAFRAERTRVSTNLGHQPDALERLVDGQSIMLGGRRWTAMVAGGHADEQICLYCEADGILLAGDQILPRISPLVAVFPAIPNGDPLSVYLASLASFAALPQATLVLPGHGEPFTGLHQRLHQLNSHHESRLDELQSYIGEPTPAFATMDKLFPRAKAGGQGRLALGETLAHLHRLLTLGRAERLVGADGTISFVARQSTSGLTLVE